MPDPAVTGSEAEPRLHGRALMGWAAVVVGVLAGVVLVGASPDIPGPARAWTIRTTMVVAHLFAVSACLAAAAANRAARLAWWLLAAAGASWLLGHTWVLASASQGGLRPMAAWLLSVPLALLALLAFPTAPRGALGQVRAILDGLIAATAAFFIGWIVVLDRHWETLGGTAADRAVLLAFLLGGVATVSVGVLVTVRARSAERLPLALVTAGLLALVVADTSLVGIGSLSGFLAGPHVAGAIVAAPLLVGLGALSARRWPVGEVRERALTLRSTVVVYVPVAAAVATVLLVEDAFRPGPVRLTTAGLGLLLILARQSVALAMQLRDQRRLEALVAEQEAEASTRATRLDALVERSSELTALVDREGRICQHSASAHHLLGYASDQLRQLTLMDIVHPDDLDRAARTIVPRLKGHPGASASVQARLVRADGRPLHVEATATNLLHDPTVGAVVYNFRDVSERKAAERHLRARLFTDPLTGLANLTLLQDRIDHALDEEAQATLLLVGLHRFRAVNDRFGHEVGDDILRQVAHRLEQVAGPDALVARKGGDEFAVLPVAGTDPFELGRRVHAELGPLELGGRPMPIRAYIGFTTCRPPAGVADVLRSAEMAMNAASAEPPGAITAFSPELERRIVAQLELEQDLRDALVDGGLTLHFQPIFRVDTARQVGVEALLRWNHPQRGPVSPAEFVAVAERSDLIGELDRWVVGEAFRQAAAWSRRWNGRAPWVAVNISSRNLHDPAFAEAVAATLRASGCSADQVVLEITETALAEEGRATGETLAALRRLGLRLAIDDFGTGQSSLGRLREFPVEKLKIDRSFIAEIEPDEPAAITGAVVGMAHHLGLEVVAEGVETQDQLDVLRELGCDFAQGWLLGYAEPADTATARLESNR